VTTADLEALLDEHLPENEVLIMAAAVADYRPVGIFCSEQKIKRAERRLTIELEATPDLLAKCSSKRKAGQTLIGFALEPEDRLLSSAREKLGRKMVDAIVANPLKTMNSSEIEATIVLRDGGMVSTPGSISKSEFAGWLLDRIRGLRS